MKEVTNRFGTGIMYDKNDLGTNIYCVCTACMSVWSDFLSFANAELVNQLESRNYKYITPYFVEKGHMENSRNATDTIVVLGCQVTDLAVYNDLRTAEELHNKYPDVQMYMGGCLAYRFDIELPNYIRRLEVVREVYQDLKYVKNLISYQKPFWNKLLKDNADPLETGNLFRKMYPLKIGAGCRSHCKYCTIRDTRGESYETDAYLQIPEFLAHADLDDGVVLISDSPTVSQIKDWCHIATRYKKSISFRNVEPYIAMMCKEELKELASIGLLKIFHCPVQSNDETLLKEMCRGVSDTLKYIDFAQELRRLGVIVATNIIIDYTVSDGTLIHNMDEEWLNSHFDYWSWNPYFDGKWDKKKARERFKNYLGYER